MGSCVGRRSTVGFGTFLLSGHQPGQAGEPKIVPYRTLPYHTVPYRTIEPAPNIVVSTILLGPYHTVPSRQRPTQTWNCLYEMLQADTLHSAH